jgi:hypothetical protein
MSQLRLVILDMAKHQIENASTQKVFADLLFTKQKNFLRTDANYVVMDKHDMIGTHYMIYDTTDLMNPKLIFAIRTTYLERAREHRLDTPLMSLLPVMEPELQEAFKSFHSRHPRLVDCNAWFVDQAYSQKNSGLRLSDIGYFLVCMNLMRFGYDNFVGCANETYKVTRWLKEVGTLERGHLFFEHPAVKCPHRLILMKDFNLDHFEEIYLQYKDLIDQTYEMFPTETGLVPLGTFAEDLFASLKKSTLADAA